MWKRGGSNASAKSGCVASPGLLPGRILFHGWGGEEARGPAGFRFWDGSTLVVGELGHWKGGRRPGGYGPRQGWHLLCDRKEKARHHSSGAKFFKFRPSECHHGREDRQGPGTQCDYRGVDHAVWYGRQVEKVRWGRRKVRRLRRWWNRQERGQGHSRYRCPAG